MRRYRRPFRSQDTRCFLRCFYPQVLSQDEIRSLWHDLPPANQRWLFLFSWLFPRCRWLVCLIICSSAFPGTEIELSGHSCLPPLVPLYTARQGATLPEAMLPHAAPEISQRVPAWVSPCLGHHCGADAFLRLPLTPVCSQNPSLLPFLPCASYVSFTCYFLIASIIIRADLWCQPLAICMYLNFLFVFSFPEALGDWLSQLIFPCVSSPSFLHWHDLCLCCCNYFCRQRWHPWMSLSLDLCPWVLVYQPSGFSVSSCGAQKSLSVGKCRNSAFQWNCGLHPLPTGLSHPAQDFLVSAISLSLHKSKHTEPNSDLIYTSKI